jgi:hypothetical protein
MFQDVIAPGRGDGQDAITRGQVLVFSLLRPEDTWSAWIDGPVTRAGIFDRLGVIGLALMVIGPACILGMGILRRWQLPGGMPQEASWSLGGALGLAVQSTIVMGLGCAGWLNGLAIGLWSATAFGLGCWWLWTGSDGRAGHSPRRSEALIHPPSNSSPPSKSMRLPAAGRLLFAAGIIVLIARSLLPPSEFDVREYHLQAPKEWFQRGRIELLPHNVYASMPLAAELQTLAAMQWHSAVIGGEDSWWWGGLAGKVVMAVYALIAGGLAAQLAARWFGASAGSWAWPLAILWPPLTVSAGLGLNESAVACYAIASAVWLDLWWHQPPASRSPLDSLIAGSYPGAALACKYTSLVLIVLPWSLLVTIALYRSRRTQPFRGRIGEALLMAAGIAIIAGPWFVKNTVQTGNPVYPLLGNVLGGRSLDRDQITRWNAAHEVPRTWTDEQGRWSSAQLRGQLVSTVVQLTSGWPFQGHAVWPLAILALPWFKSSRPMRALIVSLAIGTAGWWLLTHRLERFLIPYLPLLAVLAVGGLAKLQEWFPRGWLPMVTVPLALDLLLLCTPAVGDSRLLVDLRYLRRDDLSASTVTRLPAHLSWVNHQWKAEHPGEGLLLVGDAAVFDFEVPIRYATCFDQSPLLEQLDAVGAKHLARSLRDQGLTHLLVDWGEIERYRGPGNYGFDPRIIPELFRDLVLNDQIAKVALPEALGPVELYRIRD